MIREILYDDYRKFVPDAQFFTVDPTEILISVRNAIRARRHIPTIQIILSERHRGNRRVLVCETEEDMYTAWENRLPGSDFKWQFVNIPEPERLKEFSVQAQEARALGLRYNFTFMRVGYGDYKCTWCGDACEKCVVVATAEESVGPLVELFRSHGWQIKPLKVKKDRVYIPFCGNHEYAQRELRELTGSTRQLTSEMLDQIR